MAKNNWHWMRGLEGTGPQPVAFGAKMTKAEVLAMQVAEAGGWKFKDNLTGRTVSFPKKELDEVVDDLTTFGTAVSSVGVTSEGDVTVSRVKPYDWPVVSQFEFLRR